MPSFVNLQDESIKQKKSEFAAKLVQNLSENDRIVTLFSELDVDDSLEILSRMRVKDADTYKRLRKDRKIAYIKAKRPAAIFKKNYLDDEEACNDLLVIWSKKILSGKNGNFHNTEKSEIKSIELDEDTAESLFGEKYCNAGKHYIEINELWRAYLIIGCALSNPFISLVLNEKEEKEFFTKFAENSREFISEMLEYLTGIFKNDLNEIKIKISVLQKKYQLLAEKYSKISESLNEFSAFPTIDLAHETRSVYKDFKDLRREILNGNFKIFDFKFKEDDNYKTLTDLVSLVEEIKAFEKEQYEQNIEKALPLLKKARKIHINGTQKNQAVQAFIKQVSDIENNLEAIPHILQDLLNNRHPVSMLVDAIKTENTKDKLAKIGSLLGCLGDFCGSENSNILVAALSQNILSIGKPSSRTPSSPIPVDSEKKGKKVPKGKDGSSGRTTDKTSQQTENEEKIDDNFQNISTD